jgi:glycosyltransferase involved in cell wall biosynthesis
VKVALVHDWLTGMRGGERCLEVFCELFPEAPIYTLIYIPGRISEIIERHPIHPSILNAVPFSKKKYRYFLPVFPLAIQTFDFRSFDLVVSSSHCVAKGIRVPEGTCHISYLHTPMRYIWDGYNQYFSGMSLFSLKCLGMKLCRTRLQRWDRESNAGVYAMIANSENVACRIRSLYGREACVIHPPVEWHAFQASTRDDGFYLMVTALVPYKRVDLAVKAMNRLKLPLKIIGTGPEGPRLRNMAGRTVEFLGWRTDSEVRDYYQRCRGILFPGEEDFGIVPLEAMASGKPVVAFGKGGVLETVVPLNPQPENGREGVPAGVFFYQQSVEALMGAVLMCEGHRKTFQPEAIRNQVESFDRRSFANQVRQVILAKYEQFHQSQVC